MTEPFWDNTEEGTLEECIERAQEAFRFIVSHGGVPSRWRSFWIQTDIFYAHLAAIEFLQSSAMPSLQYLEMLFAGPAEFYEEDNDALVDAISSSPKLLFHDPPPPQLRTAKLAGISNPYLFGHPAHPQLVALTHLELDFLEQLPDLFHLNKMIAASPQLAVLSLNFNSETTVWPVPKLSEPNSQLSKIYLPKLRSLSLLHIVSSFWELSVLMMLDAPNVESLRLGLDDDENDGDGDGYQQLLDYITHGSNQRYPKPCFPSLTSLSLDDTRDFEKDVEQLLLAYPGVTTLSLLLVPTLRPLLKRPWLVPNLTKLRVGVPHVSELKKLVAARCKARLPLKTVEIVWLILVDDIKSSDRKQLDKLVDFGIVDERGERMDVY